MSNENEYNNYLKKAKLPYLDEYYTKEETDGLLEDKQNALIPGANIEITSAGTISATDTTYVASDFDVKDLTDSTGLRDKWSSKQSALTAGTNIEIDSANTINSVTYVVNLESSSTVYSTSIEPNKMYMFGEKEELTITELISGRTDIVNEYMFQFTSGSIATTLIVPNTIVWLKEPDIQTGKKYVVSIENNLGIIGEWDNE
jgi:hypothetical protein